MPFFRPAFPEQKSTGESAWVRKKQTHEHRRTETDNSKGHNCDQDSPGTNPLSANSSKKYRSSPLSKTGLRCASHNARVIHSHPGDEEALEHHRTMVTEFGMYCKICTENDIKTLGRTVEPQGLLQSHPSDPHCYICGIPHRTIENAREEMKSVQQKLRQAAESHKGQLRSDIEKLASDLDRFRVRFNSEIFGMYSGVPLEAKRDEFELLGDSDDDEEIKAEILNAKKAFEDAKRQMEAVKLKKMKLKQQSSNTSPPESQTASAEKTDEKDGTQPVEESKGKGDEDRAMGKDAEKDSKDETKGWSGPDKKNGKKRKGQS